MTRFGAVVLAIAVALLLVSCAVESNASKIPPAIISVSPSSVAAGSADFTVTVSGSNFNTRAIVTVNGSPRTTTYISKNQLTARILSGDVTQAGTIQLAISGLGSNSTSNPYPLGVTAPQPLQVATTSLPSAMVQDPYSASMAGSGGMAPYKWKLASGQLPLGVGLDSSSGILSGVPAQTGKYTFTAQVTDSSPTPQTASSPTLNLAVMGSPLVMSSAALPNGTVQVAYSAALSASGGTQPYAWSVTSGALPPGISLSATTGALSGTPSQSGGFSFTVQVKDSAASPQAAANTFTITVAAAAPPKLVISTSSLPQGTVGQSYAASLQASGGTPGYTWSVASGSLPAGLSLASSGAISGTPSSAGSSTFTVQVRDSASTPQSAAQLLTLSVSSAATPLTINSSALPGGITQTSYASAISATGGVTPYAWSVTSGSLPPGVSLNASTGAITGTPTTAGTFNFSVQVKDSSPTPQSASTLGSILIVAPLKITTTSLPTLQLQTSYNVTLGVSGGMPPYAWSVASGILPTGLSLNSSTGVLSGTPTTAGTYSFTIRVDDPPSLPQTASQAFSASVPAAPVSVSISPTGASLQVGQPQQFTATVSGSTNTGVTWDVNGIPGGNTTVGTIVGGLYLAPAAVPSPSTVTVRATSQADPTKSASASVAISAPVSPLAIVTSSLPNGAVQTAYSATFIATGGTAPYSWSVASGSLPPGLSLASSGAISGTPSSAGSWTFTVQVKGSATSPQNASQAFTLSIAAPALQITTSSLPDGQVQVAYQATLIVSGGMAPYTWSVTSGTLPTLLALLASTGQISGTPSTAGTFGFVVQVKDSAGQSASANLAINIATPPSLSIATASLPNGTVGASYSGTLQATGGTQPYTWSVTSGQLPGGLSLGAASGIVSGTPTVSGSFSFTAQVKDASSQVASIGFTVNIAAVPSGQAPSTYTSRTDRNSAAETVPTLCSPAPCTLTSSDLNSNLKYTRVTDGNTISTLPGESYSTAGSAEQMEWNVNSTLFYVTNGAHGVAYFFKLDPATQLVSLVPCTFAGTDCFHGALATVDPNNDGPMSGVSPYVFYGLNGSKIRKMDFTATISNPASADTVTTVADAATCAGIPSISGGSLLTMNGNDTRWATAFGGSQDNWTTVYVHDSNLGCRWLNLVNHTVGGAWGGSGSAAIFDEAGNPLSLAGCGQIHNVRMDLDGRWALITTQCSSNSAISAGDMYFWDIEKSNVYIGRYTGGGVGPYYQGSHIVIGRDSIFLTSDTDYAGHWYTKRTIPPNGIPVFVTNQNEPGDTHSSWNNQTSGHLQPVIVSPFQTGPPASFWQDEVIGISTDGSGTVYRFAHMYTRAHDFNATGIANVSRDGKWAIFCSDWTSARDDVFLVPLR